jgi:hypothetical protein
MQAASSALPNSSATQAAPEVRRVILICFVGMATGKLTF